MGKLVYGALQREIKVDDRMLAHLEAVTLARLRRGNAFALRWTEKIEIGDGRRTIWVHEQADLYWEYDVTDQVEFDRDLIDRLALAADSNLGIDLQFAATEMNTQIVGEADAEADGLPGR